MLGMVALLTPAIWEIPRKHPNVLHRTFVDDSSWAADTVHEARAVEALWKSWSSILQLQETMPKANIFTLVKVAAKTLLTLVSLPLKSRMTL